MAQRAGGLGLGLGLGLNRSAFIAGIFKRRIVTTLDFLLQEDGFFLLQEDGSRLYL